MSVCERTATARAREVCGHAGLCQVAVRASQRRQAGLAATGPSAFTAPPRQAAWPAPPDAHAHARPPLLTPPPPPCPRAAPVLPARQRARTSTSVWLTMQVMVPCASNTASLCTRRPPAEPGWPRNTSRMASSTDTCPGTVVWCGVTWCGVGWCAMWGVAMIQMSWWHGECRGVGVRWWGLWLRHEVWVSQSHVHEQGAHNHPIRVWPNAHAQKLPDGLLPLAMLPNRTRARTFTPSHTQTYLCVCLVHKPPVLTACGPGNTGVQRNTSHMCVMWGHVSMRACGWRWPRGGAAAQGSHPPRHARRLLLPPPARSQCGLPCTPRSHHAVFLVWHMRYSSCVLWVCHAAAAAALAPPTHRRR